ncbi:MAG: VWA domain-containing protein [Methanosarcinaceae archaeon]|nr:VWA domain-containing protein [Methanosarcinaceae archaeon]
MSENNPSTLSFQKKTAVLLENELRSTVAFPRVTPRPLREKIAEIIALEVLFGQTYEIKDPDKFIGRFGAFYPLYLTLRNSKSWPKIRKIANKSQGAGLACLKILLPLFYEVLDKFSEFSDGELDCELKELNTEMEKLILEFEMLLQETFFLRGGFSDSVFPGRPGGPESLQERVPAFMQLTGSQAFLESILQELFLRMEGFVSEMEENLELFETLTLLFPGRNWSYSVNELKKEPFYIQLKMLKRYSEFFEQNPDLKKIVDFIGRREFDPPNGPARLSPYGKTRIQTVKFSGAIDNLLPMEAAKLLNPALKKKFYADMLEGKLLSYKFLGKHFTGPPRLKPRGPLIALVDTSGSMHGSPQTLAKAAVLAITKQMLRQKRDVKVILFASVSQHLEIELSSNKMMAEKFLNFLLYTFGGGTDFNTALASGLKSLKEKDFRGADLLFITDGKSEISDELVLARWEGTKKRYNTRIYSLIVGGEGAGGLSEISDYTYLVKMDVGREEKSGVVRLLEVKTKDDEPEIR